MKGAQHRLEVDHPWNWYPEHWLTVQHFLQTFLEEPLAPQVLEVVALAFDAPKHGPVHLQGPALGTQ